MWTQFDGSLPSARSNASIAYDFARGVLVLFGGIGQGPARGLLNDTWAWDGGAWTGVPESQAPLARCGASMAFDEARGVMTLFGGRGSDGAPLDDTWIWGGGWSRIDSPLSPPSRSDAGMVYDPSSEQVMLFGGRGAAGTSVMAAAPVLGDTWAWNGSTWSSTASAVQPQSRAFPMLAYDGVNDGIILFGGEAFGGAQLQDTWMWKDGAWTLQYPSVVPDLQPIIGGIAETQGGTIRVWGLSPTGTVGPSWGWTGATWMPDAEGVSGPQASLAALALGYDSESGQTILFLIPPLNAAEVSAARKRNRTMQMWVH